MKRYAVISAGTNSCRLLVVALDRGRFTVERQESRGTRLGEGIGAGKGLSPAAIRRTLAVVEEYLPHAHLADELFTIGTSALREARNAADFLEPLAQMTGVQPMILSGDEEARASFAGAMLGLRQAGIDPGDGAAVVDIGGGSTEFAVRRGWRDPVRFASLPLGAVRLTERFFAGDPPSRAEVARCRAEIRRRLRSLPSSCRPGSPLVAVGGTANTAASMVRAGRPSRSRGTSEPSTLTADQVHSLLGAVLALPLAARRELAGLPEQRADIFPAGLLVLDAIVAEAGAHELTVSQSDLLLGYIATRVM